MVVLQNFLPPQPLPEFRHTVGSPGRTVEEGEEERHLPRLHRLVEGCDVHWYREPCIGLGHGTKIVQVGTPRIGFPGKDAIGFHGMTPFSPRSKISQRRFSWSGMEKFRRVKR